jgi:autotransporter translocation and assembly factor TamB
MARQQRESDIEEARQLWAKLDEEPQEVELKTIEHIMSIKKFDPVATVFLQGSLKAARASATRRSTLEHRLLSPRGPLTPEIVRRIVSPKSSAMAKPQREAHAQGRALDTETAEAAEAECTSVKSRDARNLMTSFSEAVCPKVESDPETAEESKMRTEFNVRRRLTRKVKVEFLVPIDAAPRQVLKRPASAQLHVKQRSAAVVSEGEIRHQVTMLQRQITESTTLDQTNELQLKLEELELRHLPSLRLLPSKLEIDSEGAEGSLVPVRGAPKVAVRRGRPPKQAITVTVKPGATRMERHASARDKVLKRPGKATRVQPVAKRPSRASRH